MSKEAPTDLERVIRALQFQRPDCAPRQLGRLRGVEMFRKDEPDAMLAGYSNVFIGTLPMTAQVARWLNERGHQ